LKLSKSILKSLYAQEAYQAFNDNVRPLARNPDGSFVINGETAHNNDVDTFRNA